MIYPTLKSVSSPDISDLLIYIPDIPDDFGFALDLYVGPKEQDGIESFNVIVCTPKWLTHHHNYDDIIVGRHHLILFEYDYQRLIQRIEKFLQQCSGENWAEVAAKVGRLGHWEFEDYQHYKGS